MSKLPTHALNQSQLHVWIMDYLGYEFCEPRIRGFPGYYSHKVTGERKEIVHPDPERNVPDVTSDFAAALGLFDDIENYDFGRDGEQFYFRALHQPTTDHPNRFWFKRTTKRLDNRALVVAVVFYELKNFCYLELK